MANFAGKGTWKPSENRSRYVCDHGRDPGRTRADVAHAKMVDGNVSMVNLCQIYTRLTDRGAEIEEIERQVRRFDLTVVSFGQEQALRAAALRPATRPFGLSSVIASALPTRCSQGCRYSPVIVTGRSSTSASTFA